MAHNSAQERHAAGTVIENGTLDQEELFFFCAGHIPAGDAAGGDADGRVGRSARSGRGQGGRPRQRGGDAAAGRHLRPDQAPPVLPQVPHRQPARGHGPLDGSRNSPGAKSLPSCPGRWPRRCLHVIPSMCPPCRFLIRAYSTSHCAPRGGRILDVSKLAKLLCTWNKHNAEIF